jgi:restriction system protein
MPVPEFYHFFRPVLEVLQDGRTKTNQEVVAAVITKLKLKQSDLEELIPSAKRTRVADRTYWALTYLFQAGLISRPKRGFTAINQIGLDYLKRAPAIVKPSDLEEFEAYRAFLNRSRSTPSKAETSKSSQILESNLTPEETISQAHEQITLQLADEVLEKVKAVTPTFFEWLIVQLMLKLGYGGAMEDAGKTLGKSGDGGIDGVIKQDKLGLDNIYLQAKRWTEGSVGRTDIQSFVGALTGVGANKGVFITTSQFSREALEYVKRQIGPKVSLVDGIQLAKLMIEYNLGVSVTQTYEIKRVDSDFFLEQ